MAISLSGFKELDKALGELPKATAKNVLRRVLNKAAQPILEDMQARAPRDSGILVSRLGISGTLTANERKGSGAEFLGLDASGGKVFGQQAAKNTVSVYIGATGKKQNSPVPMWQEFGTFDMSPHPFMAPAWEANKERALGIIEADLGAEIAKAAARLAKKQAKAAGL